MNKAVILLSGGVDSSTLLHMVSVREEDVELYALSFHYGQKHSRELEMAAWQAAAAGVSEHQTMDISSFSDLVGQASVLTGTESPVPDLADLSETELDQPPTYVPNRNMMLLSLAAAFAESRGVQRVYYGAQAQDQYGYWDCTEAFVERLNTVFSLNRREPIRVEAPFVGRSKAEVVKIGLELGVDYAHTWTCYRGGEKPCLTCPSCVERAGAFCGAGVRDPLLEA